MTKEFAESIAFMVWSDLYVASMPYVGSGLPDGRMVSFTDDFIVVSDRHDYHEIDRVALDGLEHDEAAAHKLSLWLGALLGGSSGIDRFGSGWSAWATREDGRVLEVGAFGYQLYENKEGYREGGKCQAALRVRVCSAG